jgi:hypothetical protein
MLRCLDQSRVTAAAAPWKASKGSPTATGKATRVELPDKMLQLGSLVVVPNKTNGIVNLHVHEAKFLKFNLKV